MKVLIIGSDQAQALALKNLLEIQDYQVELVRAGGVGAEYAKLGGYDLLIADTDALDAARLSREVRAQGVAKPILLLTDRVTVEDRIAFLESGADYFLLRPFDGRELLAAAGALLRRDQHPDLEICFGGTRLDLPSAKLICGEQSVRLSAREMEVMRLLLQSGEKNLGKNVILARVWGFDSNAVENHVEVYIGFLRKKLTSINADIRIASIRRLGYHLEMIQNS